MSQLSIDEDADLEAQKNGGGSEPTSPSPSSVSQQPSLPPKPRESIKPRERVSDLPLIPPRSPLLPLPPRTRHGKGKMMVLSESCQGGFDSLTSHALPLDQHDVGSQSGNRYAHKKVPVPPSVQYNSEGDSNLRSPPSPPHTDSGRFPPLPPRYNPAENISHHKSPLPLPSTLSQDMPPPLPAASEVRLEHVVSSSSQGFSKCPALPPPVTSSLQSDHTGDHPPYDKLAPITVGEYPAYDRLRPIVVLPPPRPSRVESVPPLPPRSTVDAQSLDGNIARLVRPPKLPPKGTGTNSVPPIPPKGSNRGK